MKPKNIKNICQWHCHWRQMFIFSFFLSTRSSSTTHCWAVWMWCIILAVHLGSFQLSLKPSPNQKNLLVSKLLLQFVVELFFDHYIPYQLHHGRHRNAALSSALKETLGWNSKVFSWKHAYRVNGRTCTRTDVGLFHVTQITVCNE